MPALQTMFKDALSQARAGVTAAEQGAEKVLGRIADAAGLTPIDVRRHARELTEKLNAQRRELEAWLEAWSLCLGHLNYLRTGRKTASLLDIHLLSDDDLAKKTSYAAKIGATTDPARLLPIRKPVHVS